MEGGVGGVRVGAGGLALLLAELLAEGLAQLLGGLAVDLTCEDVADGVEDDVGLLLGVVPHQLALVLCPEDDGYLVASGRGYEVVKSLDEDGGQLVEQHAARPLALVVDELEHPRGVERERSSVDGLVADRLVELSRNIAPLGRPDAAKEIAAQVIALAESYRRRNE